MMLDLKFFDEYYVGFQKQRYDAQETGRILGFAIHVTPDKAYAARKDTVDRWSEKNVPTITLKNVPASGFKIVDTVTRTMTDNKLFRVLDPRGFELEIDVDNLFHIIDTSTVVKGIIVDEMLWARRGSKNYLISKNSEEYKQHLNGNFSDTHIVGNFYANKVGNVVYRFEGTFHGATIDFDKTKHDSNKKAYWGRVTYDKDYSMDLVSTSIHIEVDNKYKAKFYVYTEYKVDGGKIVEDEKPTIHIKKSKIKDLLDFDFIEAPKVFKLETYIPAYVSSYNEDDERDYLVQSVARYSNSTYYFFFDSLEKAKAKEFSIELLENELKFKEKLEAKNITSDSIYYKPGAVAYTGISFRK